MLMESGDIIGYALDSTYLPLANTFGFLQGQAFEILLGIIIVMVIVFLICSNIRLYFDVHLFN